MSAKLSVLGAAVALVVAGSAASASVLTGEVIDAYVNHGIENDYTASGGCQFYENQGVAIGGGVEVGAANDVGGSCSGGIQADIDGATGVLTLLPADSGFGDYRWAEIILTGFTSTITGVSLIANEVFTLSGTGSVIPAPQISFTADSIRILFDPAGDSIFDVTPSTGKPTTFQITSMSAIPLPAGMPLLLAGLGALALLRRRKPAA